ncbi:MAG TPA: adenylyl-sulfate kinase [Candidatus Poseidoniales archaeon]|nr:MAG TPA: adenylyl-sulfate kinase [Candidatus Poseidoniales archaeon]HII86589.1 adenylyl-sulfate kinase [Candidatus Poseidoniaceae archaeon]
MKTKKLGRVIWVTGLSGSGKSTLASQVVAQLRASGETIVMLDGDEMREVFGATRHNSTNHGREGRLALAMQYAKLCQLIANQGVTVVCSTISMFKEVHSWNRENQPSYFEVYLKVPLSELRKRDPKGIYKRFDSGELKYVAGLDLPIDEPSSPDILFQFESDLKVSAMTDEMMFKLSKL